MKTEAEVRVKVADLEETIRVHTCNVRFAGSAMAMRDILLWVLADPPPVEEPEP